jgi:hypothetical protein
LRLLGGVVIGPALAGITACTALAGPAGPGPEPAQYTTDHTVLDPAPIPQERIGEL